MGQNDDPNLAVLDERLKNFQTQFKEKISELTNEVRNLVTVSEKKVSNETYLEEKRVQLNFNNSIENRVASLETFQQTQEIGRQERNTIFGIGKGTLAISIQVLTFISLVGALIAGFFK